MKARIYFSQCSACHRLLITQGTFSWVALIFLKIKLKHFLKHGEVVQYPNKYTPILFFFLEESIFFSTKLSIKALYYIALKSLDIVALLS